MPEFVIGLPVRSTLASYPWPMRVIWVGFDSVVCEYRDDAGELHEETFNKNQLENA